MMRLALGTVQFGMPYGVANQTGQVLRSEAQAMLELAAARGVDTLDTAVAYGESEACLGEVGVRDFKVVTKLPSLPQGLDDVQGWVRTQVSASMTRIGTSRLYGLLLHRPEQLLETNGAALYRVLQSLKESGQVEKIGVSIYSPKELDLICKSFHLDLVQAPFNLVDRRLHATGWLQRLKEHNVEIHTRSTFLQGLLLMPRTAIPPKFVRWSDLWDSWHHWLVSHQVPAVHACLAFPLSFPEIDRVVVGADSAAQLTELIDAAGGGGAFALPDLRCDDDTLVNPSRWATL